MRGALAAALLALSAAESRAYRPFAAEDGTVTHPGRLSVEMGLEHESDARARTALLPSFAWGFPRADLTLDIPLAVVDAPGAKANAGIGDVALLAKGLLHGGERLSAALGAGFKSSSGDASRGLGTGGSDFPLLAAVTARGSRGELHASAGYTLSRSPGLGGGPFWGGASALSAPGGVRVLGELHGALRRDGSGRTAWQAGVGLDRRLAGGLRADLFARWGLSGEAPARYFTAGLSWEWGGIVP